MKTENDVITGYKGFDKNLKCRGFQYEIGREYETGKKPIRCTENGFHLCEIPFDVWNYYPINNGNKYCVVEGDGEISSAKDEDSKIAVQKIKIKAAIGLFDMIKIGVDIILKKIKTTTGYYAHAATTGDSAHAATTGDFAHAATTGDYSISAGLGRDNKAKAELNSWIVLSEYDDNYKLKCVKTAKVDGKKILPNIWYQLKNGKFVKSE
jgi:hypothetical protein